MHKKQGKSEMVEAACGCENPVVVFSLGSEWDVMNEFLKNTSEGWWKISQYDVLKFHILSRKPKIFSLQFTILEFHLAFIQSDIHLRVDISIYI